MTASYISDRATVVLSTSTAHNTTLNLVIVVLEGPTMLTYVQTVKRYVSHPLYAPSAALPVTTLRIYNKKKGPKPDLAWSVRGSHPYS